MFERYTEAARRAVFFGRYQASKFGSRHMETHHMLLGVVQSAAGTAFARWFPEGLLQELEDEFAEFRTGEHISTSVDLPLSVGAKRALAYAGEEAERRRSVPIDLADVLAGLIREDPRVAEAMSRRGIDLTTCRVEMAAPPDEGARADIDRLVDTLPPERLVAAARILEALGGERVRVVVKSDGKAFAVEFPTPP